MELAGEGISVYAEAKGEYTKQLCQYMLPALQQYFLDLLDEAKLKEPEPKKVLLSFQQLLEGITDWNVDKVQRETASLSAATQCDYLEELLTAVFIAHTKVLSAIRLTTKQKKLQITIPKLDHFLHRTLSECARLLWSSTYLFSTIAPSMERQKNLRLIEAILQDGILQAIRGMLPVKNILREYLRDEADDDEEAEEEKADAEAEAEEKAEAEAEEAEPAAAVGGAAPAADIVIDVSGVEAAVEPAVDVSGATATASATAAATATASAPAPTTPVFTGADTAFATEVPEEAPVEEVEEGSDDIQILDAPPEPMDGFEDLEKKDDEILAMDFEEL
jgi:hypothetical protein